MKDIYEDFPSKRKVWVIFQLARIFQYTINVLTVICFIAIAVSSAIKYYNNQFDIIMAIVNVIAMFAIYSWMKKLNTKQSLSVSVFKTFLQNYDSLYEQYLDLKSKGKLDTNEHNV